MNDPDARILSGPALAHVRSALMLAAERANNTHTQAEMQAALDSLNSGRTVGETPANVITGQGQ